MTGNEKCLYCSYHGLTDCVRKLELQDCKFKPNYYANMLVEELEKIKEEIEVEYWEEFDGNTVIADSQIDKIFNKHIAELKGE